jgi:hypothetical protein
MRYVLDTSQLKTAHPGDWWQRSRRPIKMDKKLARHIAVATCRSSSLLANLMPTLKEHLREAEYAPFREAIPQLIVEIDNRIMKLAYIADPDLEVEIGNHIQKFGHLT